MLVVYGFILVIASPTFAMKIGSGVTTLGIPVGIGVILIAFVLTGIYTKRANGEFDDLTNQIQNDVKRCTMKWGLVLLTLSNFLFAADAQFSGKRDLNMSTIIMFLLFVVATLGITYWAARRTKTAKRLYTAGGHYRLSKWFGDSRRLYVCSVVSWYA